MCMYIQCIRGDFNNTVRVYCLDVPRFEEPLNN